VEKAKPGRHELKKAARIGSSRPTIPLPKNREKFPCHVAQRQFFSAGSGNNNDIHTWERHHVFVETEPFPDPPFDKISPYSGPETLLNHHPQAMIREPIVSKA
jgi:hypothetical protein